MENPDSPDSISSDQLTVDLLTPRTKRRRLLQSDVDIVEDRREISDGTPDLASKAATNNNNDVEFVLIVEKNF